MNHFDLSILLFLNQFAQRSETFDQLVVFVQNEAPLSGALVMGLFWWAWGRSADPRHDARAHLMVGLAASFSSIVVARIVALALPFRERPLHNPLIPLQLPFGMDGRTLIGWSSFPSDHATFFFCMAAILWMASRPLGVLAASVALFIVSFPRVYTGVHYPTDIIAGAILGCGVAYVSNVVSLKPKIAGTVLHWIDRHPASFYACLFLCTFEVGEVFTTGQDLAHPIGHVVRTILHVHPIQHVVVPVLHALR